MKKIFDTSLFSNVNLKTIASIKQIREKAPITIPIALIIFDIFLSDNFVFWFLGHNLSPIE